MMDRLVLHKLPREEGKGERGSVPIDRRVDVDGFQCGEQVSLLIVKRGEERLASQRADIVLVLPGPIDFSRRQRSIVDTAHTDDVPQLLAKPREVVPIRCGAGARPDLPGGSGVKFHLSSGTARTKSAVKRWSTSLYRTKSSID